MNIAELYAIFLQHPIITTDSRKCPEDSLFFALKGECFDGNRFIQQALDKGAALAVGDSPDLPNDERIIKVDNVLKSLQELAAYHRKQLASLTVLGITGTNGKTTSKELIAAALSSHYPILYTSGNLNNHIGVPLTLLRLKESDRFAIIEMGANHPGEIHELCEIADPDFGLITNIGKAHLEGFGSYEGVVRTKIELYQYLREKGGTVFVNEDNPLLKKYAGFLDAVYYGTHPDAFVSGKIISSNPVLHLEWSRGHEKYDLPTQLVGDYNLENVLAAICVASYFQVEAEKINRAIAAYQPANNRSQIIRTEKNQLIVDAYNANPSSMRAALENFLAYEAPKKMLIIGEMKELGDYSEEEHRLLIDFLKENAFEDVILVGNTFGEKDIFPEKWIWFGETPQLIEYLKNNSTKGFTILIKGSRVNKLEEIIPYL